MYQIIYINGSSSAGKTTLARALQNKLADPFLVLGIDQMIFMMPEKINEWQTDSRAPGFNWQPVKGALGATVGYEIKTGPFGKKMVQALKDIVLVLAKTGHKIIIDDVSFGKKEVDPWREALAALSVLWIGVTAPTNVLELREKKRGDRKIGSARQQAKKVHTDVAYDLIVDTHAKSLDENVDIIYSYFIQNK